MRTQAITDPVLTRYKAALQALYGDQLERVELFGSVRVAKASRIPITTLLYS